MRSKQVTRYWCDFCNKAGLSKHAMANHEKRCTKNIDRECRVCVFVNGGGNSDRERMQKLIDLLPEPIEHNYDNPSKWVAYQSELAIAMVSVRLHADNCPACILAALRQKGVDRFEVADFSFDEEMKAVFKMVNEEHAAICGFSY